MLTITTNLVKGLVKGLSSEQHRALRSLCFEAESAPLPIRGVVDVRRIREILNRDA